MEENRFIVDLNTSVNGYFPMPKSLSETAAGLLTRFLWSAFELSPQFLVLDHKIDCEPDEEIEAAGNELLRATFPMPCEGTDSPIAMVDRIALHPHEIQYSINRTFAAYVLSAARIPDVVRRSIPAAGDPRPLPLDERDRDYIVDALQARIYDMNVMWNNHAIYALKNEKPILPPETFGVDRLTTILVKLGASTAP